MAIITFSRGCFSHGKELAECVAAKLGYECISREVLLEASHFFQVPEAKLFKSLHDAPGLLDRITHERQHFVDRIQAALLEHVVKDNVVYHGLAGQMLLGSIAHVLRIRVIAEMEERLKMLEDRRQIIRQEALNLIEREDHERAEWYQNVYRIDGNDPRLYDMVLHIDRLTIDDACDIVCQAASGDSFRTTAQSQAALADLAMESHIKVVIEGICKADVKATDGTVHIRVQGQKLKTDSVASRKVKHQLADQIQDDLYDTISALVLDVPGVKDIDITIDRPYYV
jgi:cytidylate kinase